MRRIQNWPIALARFLKERESMPFQWGMNDCALFAADAVLAQTGIDLGARFRGQYSTKEGADVFIAEAGGLPNLITKCLGKAPELNKFLAGRGDVVAVRKNGVKAIGIVDDSGRRVAVVTENGLARLPVADIVAVWRL